MTAEVQPDKVLRVRNLINARGISQRKGLSQKAFTEDDEYMLEAGGLFRPQRIAIICQDRHGC